MIETLYVWAMVRGEDVVADIVLFPDGQTVTKWRGQYSSLTVWPEWGDMAAVHTHAFRGEDNGTTFRLRARVPLTGDPGQIDDIGDIGIVSAGKHIVGVEY